MSIQDILCLIPKFVGVGFLLGCLPLMVGLAVQAVIHIIKKI